MLVADADCVPDADAPRESVAVNVAEGVNVPGAVTVVEADGAADAVAVRVCDVVPKSVLADEIETVAFDEREADGSDAVGVVDRVAFAERERELVTMKDAERLDVTEAEMLEEGDEKVLITTRPELLEEATPGTQNGDAEPVET